MCGVLLRIASWAESETHTARSMGLRALGRRRQGVDKQRLPLYAAVGAVYQYRRSYLVHASSPCLYVLRCMYMHAVYRLSQIIVTKLLAGSDIRCRLLSRGTKCLYPTVQCSVFWHFCCYFIIVYNRS